MRFSLRRSVPRPPYRTLRGPLCAPALIVPFRSVCLSVFNLSLYHFPIHLTGWPIRLPALLFPVSCAQGRLLMGVYLMSVHLIGVCLIDVHLTAMHLTGVHLTGVYLIKVHLTSVCPTGVYVMGVH